MTVEAIYCFDRATVRFALYPNGERTRVLGEITEDALRALFHARGGAEGLLQACELNFSQIETRALEQYAGFPMAPIFLRAADFLQPAD